MAREAAEQLNNEEKERQKALNRERVARCRAKKKAEQAQKAAEGEKPSSYAAILSKMNAIVQNYGGAFTADSIYAAFTRAGKYWANEPTIQNARVKAISSLPADFTKEDIGEFLRNPYGNEQPLRQTSETLKWTTYPYFKIIKTYQDIPTYRYYTKPLYLKGEEAKTDEFWREAVLLDKLNKELRPDAQAHKIAGEALAQGKVFYHCRVKADKSHNRVDYAFLEALPIDWCTIIGRNNVSGWTVSFNLMYFVQAGTDMRQYGDLFEPYITDFEGMFIEPKETKRGSKAVYASIKGKNGTYNFYPDNLRQNANGSPRVFKQDGRWFYYVSLPVDKVWTFEIDDATPNVASPLSGLLMTYSQQADYEAAQLSLLLNPLIKIFTGEIPYFNDTGSTAEDGYRLSIGGRAMFQAYFNDLMRQNNTSGTAFFSAPVQNIKSHDYPESANANKVASSFNEYSTEKSGLAAIIPISDPKAGQANLSAKLEARYTECIYRQFERMVKVIYEGLNLRYEWDFRFFGTIYTDEETRKSANADIANGDVSAMFILAALDGQSWLDKLSMIRAIKGSGILDLLTPPATSYTAGKLGQDKGGRPKNEGITEGNEKSADSGDGGNE